MTEIELRTKRDPEVDALCVIPEFLRWTNPARVEAHEKYWADPANRKSARSLTTKRKLKLPPKKKRRRRGADMRTLYRLGYSKAMVRRMSPDDCTFHAMKCTPLAEYEKMLKRKAKQGTGSKPKRRKRASRNKPPAGKVEVVKATGKGGVEINLGGLKR